ncbi:MAG: hypothetical protein WDM78_20955 [Puia sp.]
MSAEIGNNKNTYSNGAVYADFDNDGDLDILVNNIEDPAILYENKSNDKKDKAFVEIKLKGPVKNIMRWEPGSCYLRTAVSDV